MKKQLLFFGAFFVLTNWLLAKESISKSVKLNSGYEMPVLGLGTWTLQGSVCENAVYSAFKDGYAAPQ